MGKLKTKELNMWNQGFISLYFACFIAFLNSAINGYDLSLINNVVILNPFIRVYGEISIDKDPNFYAWFNGLLQLGSVIGCFFVGPMMNYLGRVRAMALGSIIIIAGGVLEILPRSLIWLQIGRFLVGFGVVFVTTAAPTYVVEIAHPVFRGRAGAAYNTGWSVGSIPAAVLCWGMAYVDNDWAWILPLLVQCCFSGAVLVGCFFIPESPRWLMSKGRVEEARKFFVKYHADGNEKDPVVDQQMQDFHDAMKSEATSMSFTFYDLFRTNALRYQMMLLFFMAFFTQYAGNYVNGYFLTQLLPYFGVDASNKGKTLMFNTITQLIGCIAGFVGAGFADTYTRRNLLIGEALLVGTSMAGLTLFCGLFSYTGAVTYGMFAFVFLQFFSIGYSFCYTPLQSLYCVEILDFKARATGMAFEQLLINGLAYLQNYILANGAKDLGWKFFAFYIVVDYFAAGTFWRYFPETKGKTLEEIEDVFADPRGPVKASLHYRRNKKREI